MIVWQMLAALGMGGILGAGGVSGWMRWRVTRVPLVRAKAQRMGKAAGDPFAEPLAELRRDSRLVATFDVRHPDDPMGVDEPVRMTYVRGPVRGRDTDHG